MINTKLNPFAVPAPSLAAPTAAPSKTSRQAEPFERVLGQQSQTSERAIDVASKRERTDTRDTTAASRTERRERPKAERKAARDKTDAAEAPGTNDELDDDKAVSRTRADRADAVHEPVQQVESGEPASDEIVDQDVVAGDTTENESDAAIDVVAAQAIAAQTAASDAATAPDIHADASQHAVGQGVVEAMEASGETEESQVKGEGESTASAISGAAKGGGAQAGEQGNLSLAARVIAQAMAASKDVNDDAVSATPGTPTAPGGLTSLGAESAGKPQSVAQSTPSHNAEPAQAPQQTPEDTNVARVARALQQAVKQNGGTVTLRLNPPELGVVRVQMELSNGVASVRFQAEDASVTSMLSRQMITLREALEGRGLKVQRMEAQTLPSTPVQSVADTSVERRAESSPDQGRSRGGFTRGDEGRPRDGDGSRRRADDFSRALVDEIG